MGLLEDLRKVLADIPLWKELGTIPDRTKVLEAKIAELVKTRDKTIAWHRAPSSTRQQTDTSAVAPANKSRRFQADDTDGAGPSLSHP